MNVSRRAVLAGAVLSSAAAGLAGPGAVRAGAQSETGYLVGCGIADMTGAVAGQAMMGYSDAEQIAEGLLQRCWARAYVIADRATGQRVVFVTADVACLFQSVHLGVIAELGRRFGDLYTETNVNLNATHTHASCAGTSWDFAYSLAAMGFKAASYRAEVDGIVEAVVRAHESLAPGTVRLGRGELFDASANRSRGAFDRNPAEEKALFPDAIDPAVTVLRLSRGGTDVGAITWFATHGTSLTDRNYLIAGDNKGYASYRWEHDEHGVRHTDGPAAFVAAFPQTNAGDLTPNLNLAFMHPSGPTEDNRLNCAIIGERQYQAGRTAFALARPMRAGGVGAITHYLDLSAIEIDGTWTPDGKPARTGPAMMGAAGAATSTEDNWRSQLGFLREGTTNPFVAAVGGLDAPVAQWMRDVQAPKLIAAPLGLLPAGPWVPQIVPIQILRIGELVLAAAPAEFTVVAGLRVRRVVARALGTAVENVLLQGYSNGYTQYVTTPEEYDAQQYEGGETLFGRWTLSAYLQEFDRLARALAAGGDLGRGPAPLDKSGFQPDLVPPIPADEPPAGHAFGEVLGEPPASCRPGETVVATFAGAHPHNDLRHGGTYLEVQRREGPDWRTVHDDNDWCTEFRWARTGTAASTVTLSWTVPEGTEGTFRLVYSGDRRDAAGGRFPIGGATTEFAVS
ncbi:neutral/alkaline ceramidase [Nocardia thailandica]